MTKTSEFFIDKSYEKVGDSQKNIGTQLINDLLIHLLLDVGHQKI